MEGLTERSPLLLTGDDTHGTQTSAIAKKSADGGPNEIQQRLSAASLPRVNEDCRVGDEPVSKLTVWTVIPILLLGVFVSNADSSLVIATSQRIGSEFNVLSHASWIVTSYLLALSSIQPLYGKLSDIFGRKANLVVAHILFGGGCLLCGTASSFWHVLAGRAISGVGGAGITALVSIIVSDMVPVRDVAAWRSYVNIVATLGRSLGGPVGGWLSDTIGWRWSFLGQVPLTLLGFVLILWKFQDKPSVDASDNQASFSKKLQRVDFAGALALAVAICALLLAFESSSNRQARLLTVVSSLTFMASSVIFCMAETFWATEPILPLQLLLRRDALTAYTIAGFQTGAQFGAFYCTPIYYQITTSSSASAAGMRLVPAVIGNTVGALLSGHAISSTGRYKLLSVLASLCASVGYTLMLIRWSGNTGWPESLYIFPGGFGAGVLSSTTFVHLAASLDQSDIAIAGTALYMAQNVFLLIGVQVATSVLQSTLRFNLWHDLEGFKNKKQIIERAISSIDYIWDMPTNIKDIITVAYVKSLRFAFGTSIAFALLGMLIGVTIRERKI